MASSVDGDHRPSPEQLCLLLLAALAFLPSAAMSAWDNFPQKSIRVAEAEASDGAVDFYALVDTEGCTGALEDPHPVHGFQATDGSYIFSGKGNRPRRRARGLRGEDLALGGVHMGMDLRPRGQGGRRERGRSAPRRRIGPRRRLPRRRWGLQPHHHHDRPLHGRRGLDGILLRRRPGFLRRVRERRVRARRRQPRASPGRPPSEAGQGGARLQVLRQHPWRPGGRDEAADVRNRRVPAPDCRGRGLGRDRPRDPWTRGGGAAVPGDLQRPSCRCPAAKNMPPSSSPTEPRTP